jgi:ribosomal protein S18 acetylase RimI-like enzyme
MTPADGSRATSPGGEALIRRLDVSELTRVAEIDRTETIDAVYVQRGDRVEVVPGDRSVPPWDPEGTGEHSIAAQREAVVGLVASGAVALGAFKGDRLVGIGVVLAHLRPGAAQLAYLHVSDGFRGCGIGGRLSDELERLAREAGDTSIVVSATPSYNTVGFYRRRGYEPVAEPFPKLYELEPEDVHMTKPL